MASIRSSIRYICRRIVWLLLLIPYLISTIIPRKKNQWVFGSGGGTRFEENSKYLYLYTVNKTKTEAVWISKNRDVVEMLQSQGYPAKYTYSFGGLIASVRAEYSIVSFDVQKDLPWYLLGGSCIVQLWHGIPLKNIGWKSQWYRSPLDRFLYRTVFWRFCLFLSPSERAGSLFQEAFKPDEKTILNAGYPRDDPLFDTVKDSQLGVESTVPERISTTDRFVVGYFPTFRHYDFDQIPGFDINFSELDDILGEFGCTLLIKHHPNMSIKLPSQQENIVIADETLDPYLIMNDIDLLVTDYSSIYFDYLLTDQPIIFYVPDRKSYFERTGFLLDYDTVTPGPSVSSSSELVNWIKRFKRGEDPYERQRKEIKEEFFDYHDGRCSKRVYNYICQK